jgi:hypothetical protein
MTQEPERGRVLSREEFTRELRHPFGPDHGVLHGHDAALRALIGELVGALDRRMVECRHHAIGGPCRYCERDAAALARVKEAGL